MEYFFSLKHIFIIKKYTSSGHTEKVGPRTWDSRSILGTQDAPHGALHLGPWTQNPQAEPGTQDLYVGTGTWDPSSGTHDPICGNRDPIPLRGTWNPYLGTLTLIQLSLNVQFRSVAQLFLTGSYTNLYHMTEESITQLKT